MKSVLGRARSGWLTIRATYVDTPFVQVSFEQSERVIGAVICQASFCNFHMLRAGMD